MKFFNPENCRPVEPSTWWLNYIKNNFYYSNGQVFKRNRVKPIGSLTKKGYLTVNLGPIKPRTDKKNFKVHILAWYLFYGVWPENEIDHKNNVRNCNFIDNLEIVDRQKNLAKRRKSGNVAPTEDPF